MRGIYIGATGQNVGKTTICLGLIALCQKSVSKLGFMKPVGQQHQRVADDQLVDKDVVLFKEHFHLPHSYKDMSPIIFPSGFTKQVLDGKIACSDLKEQILTSYKTISSVSDFTIVEGTGHIGVGSVAALSNAEVAAALNLDVILIVKGGVGSAFDELALNKALLDKHGVKLKGVILNRVLAEKKEMVEDYIHKGLKRWGVPLIGSIPYNRFLSTPSMEDFETLFGSTLISGQSYHYRHFKTIRLVATSVSTFKEGLFPNQLIVTPATREDIIDAILESHLLHPSPENQPPEHGVILTGRHPPTLQLSEKLKTANIPSLYAAMPSFTAMKLITSYIAKIRVEDVTKVQKAIDLVGSHVNLPFFK